MRAALSRFDQVSFEDDDARERARKGSLNAAKKYGIVPVGFIRGQLQSEGRLAQGERVLRGLQCGVRAGTAASPR